MKVQRLYVDTSVFGGCFDDEFEEPSRDFFALVESVRIRILVSPIVLRELAGAPPEVRGVLDSLPLESIVPVEVTPEAIELRDAYLRAGIVAPRYVDDATHVAIATVSRAEAVVSWNFRHLVRIDKIRGYNQVNLASGYGLLSIVSPLEVRITDDDEE